MFGVSFNFSTGFKVDFDYHINLNCIKPGIFLIYEVLFFITSLIFLSHISYRKIMKCLRYLYLIYVGETTD